MRKFTFLPVLISLVALAGCASEPELLQTGLSNLETKVRDTRDQVAQNMRKISEHSIQIQYAQQASPDDNYEQARIKNQIQVLDDTFSRDLMSFREKLREAERLIEAQAARLKALEEAQILAESSKSTAKQ